MQNLYIGVNDAGYEIPQKNGKISIKQEDSWKTSKNMMKDPLKFMDNLNAYKGLIDDMRIPPLNFA